MRDNTGWTILLEIEEEIKSRNYNYCTISNCYGDEYLAKVAYSDKTKAWHPTDVELDGEWVSRDYFDNTEDGESYSCGDYRTNL